MKPADLSRPPQIERLKAQIAELRADNDRMRDLIGVLKQHAPK